MISVACREVKEGRCSEVSNSFYVWTFTDRANLLGFEIMMEEGYGSDDPWKHEGWGEWADWPSNIGRRRFPMKIPDINYKSSKRTLWNT